MARPQEFETTDVLQKAMSVFWRYGYKGTPLEDLLIATGLSKSSFYNTFGSKEELFLEAFDTYRAERKQEMHQVLEHGPARQAIETFFRTIIPNTRSPEGSLGCMITNQAVEQAPHEPKIRKCVEEDFQVIEDALTRTIERGQEDGSVGSQREAHELARLFVVALPGFHVMARAEVGRSRLEDALRVLLANLD
jgi:TetR/AcrR family transcriptional repressor of nem operon